MKNANFIAIDFETATPKREPCQIGIVVVKNGIITEKISKLIQPPKNKYSLNCTRVHGINSKMTENTPTFEEVWKEIKIYFEGNFVLLLRKDKELRASLSSTLSGKIFKY